MFVVKTKCEWEADKDLSSCPRGSPHVCVDCGWPCDCHVISTNTTRTLRILSIWRDHRWKCSTPSAWVEGTEVLLAMWHVISTNSFHHMEVKFFFCPNMFVRVGALATWPSGLAIGDNGGGREPVFARNCVKPPETVHTVGYTNTRIPIHKCQYTNADTQIQIHKYKHKYETVWSRPRLYIQCAVYTQFDPVLLWKKLLRSKKLTCRTHIEGSTAWGHARGNW